MAATLVPPFRADHVGSLLRPVALHHARAAFQTGTLDADGLRAAENSAIDDVVAMQQDIGLHGVTDGEFRRASWHMDFIYQLGGITKVQENLAVTFHNKQGDISFTPSGIRVTERLRLDSVIFEDAFNYLAARAGQSTAKLTIPSPSMVHYRGGAAAIADGLYDSIDEFWSDLAGAYRDQIQGLGALGCRYLQLDDTSLAYLNDPSQRAMIDARGESSDNLHVRYIDTINQALAGRPEGMRVTTHMCRGNFRSSWVASGDYEHVADALFNELNVDGFFMEWDDERSGGFEPLRLVPPGKFVVLGLVTTKKADLESKDQLKRRIDEAARFVPLEQLCLSPQCGFSSTVEGNDLTLDDQIAKLRLVVETANEVWG